jgi:hypothetical protein
MGVVKPPRLVSLMQPERLATTISAAQRCRVDVLRAGCARVTIIKGPLARAPDKYELECGCRSLTRAQEYLESASG